MPLHVISLQSEDFTTVHLEVASLSGREVLGQLGFFEVSVQVPEAFPLDTAEVRGANVTLTQTVDGVERHRWYGVVTEVVDTLEVLNDERTYFLRLEPTAHRLSLVRMQDIFLDTSDPDIIRTKFERVGLTEQIDFHCQREYDAREFVLQYEESDLAFVSRRAEHLGLTLLVYQDTESERDVVRFVDNVDGFPELAPVSYDVRGDIPNVILSLRRRHATTSARVMVQEYNYRTPTVNLVKGADVPDGQGGGIVEWGNHFKTETEGEFFAGIRAEEIRARQVVYTGTSTIAGLAVGHRLPIENHPFLSPEESELLIIEVNHRSGGQDGGEALNDFVAIPSAVPYRPPRVTPRPHMAGIYTAIIQPKEDAFVADLAELDDEGRYKVRFFFDSQPRDGATSRPIRMMQPHSGAGHGMHFPLRPGVEVLVGFANGDPDRPVILGAVDNAATRSPSTAANPRANVISTMSGVTFAMVDAPTREA
ncbi:MAG: type VI secretion system tip protein VgrG [Myxococcota bacterium]